MPLKLNLIAAVCNNMGIGRNNDLPWRIKAEMAHFNKMTTETKTNKKNVVIMGRKTWDSIPLHFRPLSKRINFVLSNSDLTLDYKDCYAFKSLEDAIAKLNDVDYQKEYENVWVIGGSNIYKASMNNKYFYRLYLTEIKKHYECDTFFPKLDLNKLKEVIDPSVPTEMQEENGIPYLYKVYQNMEYQE